MHTQAAHAPKHSAASATPSTQATTSFSSALPYLPMRTQSSHANSMTGEVFPHSALPPPPPTSNSQHPLHQQCSPPSAISHSRLPPASPQYQQLPQPSDAPTYTHPPPFFPPPTINKRAKRRLKGPGGGLGRAANGAAADSESGSEQGDLLFMLCVCVVKSMVPEAS